LVGPTKHTVMGIRHHKVIGDLRSQTWWPTWFPKLAREVPNQRVIKLPAIAVRLPIIRGPCRCCSAKN